MERPAVQEGVKLPRGAKARVVREGLKAGMTNEEIIKFMEEIYPGQKRRLVQQLISRYRFWLKVPDPKYAKKKAQE